MEVIIGRLDLSNDALLGNGTELVVDTGDEGHAPSCVELDDRSGSHGLLFMINRDAERFILAQRRLARPDLHRQLAPAADNILLLLGMGMCWSCHPFFERT
jgi:hypothetical protein